MNYGEIKVRGNVNIDIDSTLILTRRAYLPAMLTSLIVYWPVGIVTFCERGKLPL